MQYSMKVASLLQLDANSWCMLQEPVYRPYLTLLAKLVFLSSAIHQLVFVLSSTLPFAVGQVQDVGLIFLSAMATSVAGKPCHLCKAWLLDVEVKASGISCW